MRAEVKRTKDGKLNEIRGPESEETMSDHRENMGKKRGEIYAEKNGRNKKHSADSSRHISPNHILWGAKRMLSLFRVSVEECSDEGKLTRQAKIN